MPRLIRAVVAALAASCLIVGCQPSAPMPTPSPSGTGTSPSAMPTPTFLCTPEAGGDESPCTQAQYDEMKAKDALYAEAEEVYRRFSLESVRLSRAGGTSDPTPVLLETSAGEYLENMMAIFRRLEERHLHAEGDDPKITVSRLPGQSKAGSVVALSVCIDSRGWGYYSGTERVADGRVAVDEVYFARVGDALKMIGADGREVTTCAT